MVIGPAYAPVRNSESMNGSPLAIRLSASRSKLRTRIVHLPSHSRLTFFDAPIRVAVVFSAWARSANVDDGRMSRAADINTNPEAKDQENHGLVIRRRERRTE
jgi:hypothetical protein